MIFQNRHLPDRLCNQDIALLGGHHLAIDDWASYARKAFDQPLAAKGKVPKLAYGCHFVGLWESTPSAPSLRAACELLNAEFVAYGVATPLPQFTRDRTMREDELTSLMNLFFPFLKGQSPITMARGVYPYAWCNATLERQLFSFRYSDSLIKVLCEDMAAKGLIPMAKVPVLCERVLRILVQLMKMDDFAFTRYVNNNLMAYLHGRVIELLVGRPVWEAYERQADRLGELQRKNDLCLNVAQAQARRFDRDEVAGSVLAQVRAGTWWPAGIEHQSLGLQLEIFDTYVGNLPFAVNDFARLEVDLMRAERPTLQFFLDDVGEGVFDLAFLQSLMQKLPQLRVGIWVNERPIDNNFWRDELRRVLQCDFLKYLDTQVLAGRCRIHVLDLPLCTPEYRFLSVRQGRWLQTATAVLIKGANFFEVLGGAPVEVNRYFMFDALTPTTVQFLGESGPVCLHVGPGQVAFRTGPKGIESARTILKWR